MSQSAATQLQSHPPKSPLKILYRDDFLIAIDKPSRLLVHRSELDRHESNNALQLLAHQTGCYLYPVHRLDKPTSGVLLFALDKETARYVSRQFEEHRVMKEYAAVVRGYCIEDGVVDYSVRDRDAKHKPRQPATTNYSNLATIEFTHRIDRYPTTRYSLLKLQPLSGRRHQLRLHMKHINHPIIGDTSYGKRLHNQFFSQSLSCTRLLLHAYTIRLTHPNTLTNLQISAPVTDPEFKRVLVDSRWQWHDQNAKARLLPG